MTRVKLKRLEGFLSSDISGKQRKMGMGFFKESVVRLGDFYRLCWALSFACQAFYAVFFSGWIGFLLGIRMAR
jgi:hypothetical protein